MTSPTIGPSPKKIRGILLESAVVTARASGKSFGVIASELGIPKRTAYSAFQRAMKRESESLGENVQALRAVAFLTLDRLLLALAPKIDAGDPNAINTAVAIEGRRARLCGLDCPIRTENANTNTNINALPMDPAEVIAEIRRHAAELTGSQPKRKLLASLPALPAPAPAPIDVAAAGDAAPLPPAEVIGTESGDDASDDDLMIDPPPDAADHRNGRVADVDESEPPVRPVHYKQWCESLGRHVHVLPPKN